jgi:hypothetical protein
MRGHINNFDETDSKGIYNIYNCCGIVYNTAELFNPIV